MSLGKGLGQQTGASAEADRAEAIKLLEMIASCDWAENLNEKDVRFIEDMLARYEEATFFPVTGKQLFYLRDVKDKLIQAGVL